MSELVHQLEEVPGNAPAGLPEGWAETPSGLWVPIPDGTEEAKSREPVACDLFCGCGGFSLGVHSAGVDVVAATDSWAEAAHVYLLNLGHPDCRIVFADESAEREWNRRYADLEDGWVGSGYRASPGSGAYGQITGGCRGFVLGDVQKVTGEMLLEAAGVDRVDVVIGGPPCQGLSKLNARACLEDPRNGLLWEYMRIVEDLQPAYFVMENVPQILSVAGGALFEGLASLANEAGYNVTANVLDAADYGVPQYRRRAFIAGTQLGRRAYQFPMPTHWPLIRSVNGDDTTMRWAGEPEERHERRAATARKVRFDHDSGRWEIDDVPAAAPKETDQPDLFAAAGEGRA